MTAAYINRAQILGNMGQMPEYKALSNGTDMAKITVATSHYTKSKGSDKFEQHTQWHNVVIYNKFVIEDLKKYAARGMKVFVEGEINHREYLGKDNVKRKSTEIVVTDYKGQLIMLDKKIGTEPTAKDSSVVAGVDYSDMPF